MCTETEHKKELFNIQDTINCVQIASFPLKKEFRVFNQFTEFFISEMAQKIKDFGDKNKLNPEISHITNPRIERGSLL